MCFIIKRRLDKLGRIVFPIDIRNAYGITYGAKVSFSAKGNKIFISKESSTCKSARTVDKLGRVVLPIAIRDALGFREGDALNLAPAEEGIYIYK